MFPRVSAVVAVQHPPRHKPLQDNSHTAHLIWDPGTTLSAVGPLAVQL